MTHHDILSIVAGITIRGLDHLVHIESQHVEATYYFEFHLESIFIDIQMVSGS